MGTIKIGSSKDKKGITVNPSVVLFNGNNVKKIMSGATTIWEDIRALIHKMSSNTSSEGTASATENSSTAYNAFDKSTSTSWYGSGYSNVAVQFKFNSAKKVTYFDIYPAYASSYLRVKNFKLQGSNNGSTWTDLYSGAFSSNTNVGKKTYNISNPQSFTYYRLLIVDTHESVACGITELQLYGS